jgi:hypothetical protein
MAKVTLPLAINLSYWLYRVHPEVFTALLNQAKGRPSGLGTLGDDGGDFYTGISVMPDDTSSFDVGNFVSSDAGSITTSDINATISPDLVSLPQSQAAIGSNDFYTGITPMPAADTNADVGNFLANSDAPSLGGSSPSTLNPPVASNVGAVAGVITAGLGALAAVTTAIYKAGTPQASTIGTQANRVANGVTPAPITYGYNSQGQLVPVLASTRTGTVGALTPQTLASLGVPSSWGPYILPLAGILALVAINGASKK